jgi:hypothetical protein
MLYTNDTGLPVEADMMVVYVCEIIHNRGAKIEAKKFSQKLI